MSVTLNSKEFAYSLSSDFPVLKRDDTGSLGNKKTKQILNKNKNKENINQSNFQTNLVNKKSGSSHSATDAKFIETALKVSQSQLEHFNDKQNHESLVKAVSLNIAEARESAKQVAMGGFKNVEIGKWKFVVLLDEKGKINQLFIGQFKAQGSYTKVYLSLDDKAILVPKKKASSDEQMALAFENISKLHADFEEMEDFTSATKNSFAAFNYSKQEFIKFLPAKPQKIQVGSRLILIAPQATCVAERFRKAPASLQETIHRIEIMRDVTLGVALMHSRGFVHGDLKPENMLMDRKGRAQPHDVGGGNFFFRQDNEYVSREKLYSLTRTPLYTHYNDIKKIKYIKMIKGDEYYHLGCAGDVFALGVSTLEALSGLEYRNGMAKYPFDFEDYHIEDGRKYVKDSRFPREFWCVADESSEVDHYLKQSLKSTLHQNHECRPPAIEFAESLDAIIGLLKNS